MTTRPHWIGAIGCMGSAPPARYRAELADPATRFEFLDRMVRQYADAGAYAIYWHNLQGVEPGAKMSAPFSVSSTTAVTGMVLRPTWMLTCGCATRLRYQAAVVPQPEATT